MKPNLLLLICSFFFLSCSKEPMETSTGSDPDPVTNAHPKADSLGRIMNKYANKGIPGLVLALQDGSGYWAGAAGYAKLENSTSMRPTNLQYGFSITKIFTATAIMQLKEKGLIHLDEPIRNYLPANLHQLVPRMDEVTVRMLLQQSSGYNDYVRLPEFQLRFLDNPLHVWTRAEYYDLMKRKVDNQFAPGTDFLYSNTNYYLLALMIDQVTGRPHGEWFQRELFDRLGLKETFYKHSAGYPFYNRLSNSYWPRLDNGQIENISRAQQAWMQSEEYGATGIISSPKEYLVFLKGLLQGGLVSAASLSEMRTWIQGKESVEPDYGLGLTYWGYKGKMQYGHDGDGIGAAANLMYFPASDTYVFFAANSTTELGGDMLQTISDFRNEVGNYLAGF